VFYGNNVKVPELSFDGELISDATDHVSQIDKALDDLVARAMQGDAAAQYDLGYRYQNGIGVEKDEERAVYWYIKAAEQGNAVAQDRLQFLTEEKGISVPFTEKSQDNNVFSSDSDDSEFKDLSANVTQGDTALGLFYANGIGMLKDEIKSEEVLTKAAEQGHSDAQDQLISL
jgi:TPR repeat protein